jgi:hypothetical protein
MTLEEQIRQITKGKPIGSQEAILSAEQNVKKIQAEISSLQETKNDRSFDPEVYLANNPDLAGGYFSQSAAKAREHYDKHGAGEGRISNKNMLAARSGKTDQEIAAKNAELAQANTVLSSIIQPSTGTREQDRINQDLLSSAQNRDYIKSGLSGKTNFQISDNDIISDYNTQKIAAINNVVSSGNTQISAIQNNLNSANSLISSLAKDDPARTRSQTYIDQLNADLASVTNAVTTAQDMAKNFKPITPDSSEGLKEITAFRSFAQLPEERASQQLYQIDPESYRTAVGLGQQYRQMATEPIGATTTPETEQLRQTLQDEAINQLRLGSTIGAEERRGYEQSIRAAQTARGNIFGLGPAVQEASQIGAAGEARKLARYGAAQSFLGSGQSTGDALKADIAFRDALRQNRLGAAANFIGGGPSLYNLGQARTAQQQGAFQNYVQANQALPGGFNQQPSTAAPFYQAVDQQIPVQLTNAFNNLYRSQADYQASTYGAQVGAISRQPNGFQNFATAAGGVADLGKTFGGLASAGVFCWVAREVYGIDNPKWLQFREWMLTKASDNLRNYYIEYGERIAESIRNKPRIKDLIRKWMDSKIG